MTSQTIRTKMAGALMASAVFSTLVQPAWCAAPESGFTSLFNGKDLEGWNGDPKLWSVKDGAITGRSTAEAPLKANTFLIWTNGALEDFELRCSFKITPNNDQNAANSGIQYRSKVLDPGQWSVGGYQADFEAGPTYTGILYEEKMSRGIMAARGEKVTWDKECKKQVTGLIGKSEELQAAIKKADWNDYTIIARGNHLQHFVNGKQTVDVMDDCEAKRAMKGVLALQLHVGPPMTVQFRDMRLKTLAADSASAADEFKKLQGAWQIAEAEADGEAVGQDIVGSIVVRIKDETYSVTFPDRTDEGTLKLDPSKQPRTMDIHPRSGEDSGRMLPAIYEISGPDSFKVCYARQGNDRPTKFSTQGQYGYLLIHYKRKAE